MTQQTVTSSFVGWRCVRVFQFTALLAISVLSGLTHVHAQTLFWDSDADGSNAFVGGAGTWDITSFQWDPDADNTNSNNAVWANGANIASFGGAAGIVTLGVPITVGGLEFTSSGYEVTGTGANPLTLTGPGTINVSAGNRAAVTADIAGTVGLVKTGLGTLNLGPSNSFTGSTVINAGVVEVYKNESLGSGNGAIQINGGTLSALGNSFYSTRNIEVGASGATLDVTRDYSNWGSMRLKGEISGSGTLTKSGFGQLRLDGDSSGFTGAVVLEQGIVRLNPYLDRGQVENVPILGGSSYTVHSGADLQLLYYGIGTTPYYSAINDTAPVIMKGGRIYYASNSSGAVSPWTQSFGDLTLDRGASRLVVQRQSTGAATLMSFGNLTRSPGATVDFRGQDNTGALQEMGTLGNQPLIKFASIPAPVNDGILGGWATVAFNDFADYDPEFGVRTATYTSTDILTAGATDNVDFSQGAVTTMIGDTSVNALKWTITDGVTSGTPTSILEQTNGSTLTIDSGGLLTIGNFYKSIQPESGGTSSITANGGALYVHSAQSNLYIYSTIVDGDMSTALVKTQAGTLLLYGSEDNTYSGGTYINGAGNVYAGTTSAPEGQRFLGSGPVFVTRGILNLRSNGATSSTEGYTAFEGGSIYLDDSTQAWTDTGDRFTIDGTSSIGGQSRSAGGGGLNSLTYVSGPVTAPGEAQIAAGATIVHGTNATVMGAGTNTIQNLPNDMQFFFGPGPTTTSTTTLTIGEGTPWRGLGTDRNTRDWDEGTITVNGSEFELRAMLAPNQNGEGQSSYTLRIGGGSLAAAPVITGAASTPLTAHVTGGYVGLDAGSAVYGSIAAGSPLTFQVEAGGSLEISQETAMGTGDGLASIVVLDGGTLQQYGSTDATRLAAAETGINGSVTVQPRGRFLAHNTNGLSGTGQIHFEPRSIIQINNNTGWTGPQALAATGVNDAIVRLQVDNFGTAAETLLTTYFDGTGIYEWSTNANAANPNTVRPIVSLNGAPGSGRGLIINDAFDRSLDATSNGFIELKVGGAGGTIAATSGQLFNINEDVELNGLMLTIGYADVIDGDPGLGDVRMDAVTDSVGTGTINVINGAQLRISATNAIQEDIEVILQDGAWLDIDEAQTLETLTGLGAGSRVLGDNYLTLTRAGDYDLNVSFGDNARLTQMGGGVLTLTQNADGNGIFAADGAGNVIKIGTGVSIGTSYTLNPINGGVIDANGQTLGASNLTGDSTGTIELNNGVLLFENSGTVTIDSGEAAINGPGTIRLIGTGQVRFNQDPTRMTNISQIDIFNGEFRVDGQTNVADSFLIDAPIINLGDGFATTGGTGFQSFPRLYLVNAETTQTAALNVNGGWITSDLGGSDITIWSGPIDFTGTADTNIFDVNDAGVGDQHAVTGVISGTGGFSKVNAGTLRLEANNTIQGDIYIQRNGVGGTNIDSTASRGGIRLTEANGALSAANSVVISRDGSFYLNNATDVNNDRVGNATDLLLRGEGRMRLIGNATLPVSETMGDLRIDTGSGKVNFDLDDTTPQAVEMTFSSFTRDPGSIAQFLVLDNVVGAFGSPLGGVAKLFITDSGASAQMFGGPGVNSETNKPIVKGVFGGVNNLANHFMTFDSASPTELRPLVWDGTPAGSEYFLSREAPTLVAPHQFTVAGLVTNDQNVLINFNVDPLKDGEVGTGVGGGYGWYGNAPIAILENVAMNSLRFGTDTPTNGANTNEIGSTLVLAPGARLYLGDKAAIATGPGETPDEIGAITTSGSGMILFGRDISGGPPNSNQFISGGYLDFGTREAIIVNESGNSAFIRSNIYSADLGGGTGAGLTKAGANNVYLDNSNSYYGTTNIAEGLLLIRDQHALGNSNLVRIEGSGRLYLESGTNVRDKANGGSAPALYIGVVSTSTNHLFTNGQNNTWGGDVIIDNVDNLGNMLFDSRIGVNARDTLNINGNIYGNELGAPDYGIAANAINADTALNDARYVTTNGSSASGGVINLFGQVRDNYLGAIGTPVTPDNENQLLRFIIRGSNELVVNAKQQWNAAGQIRVEQGLLRFEGDGNFYTDQAAANMDAANGQSGMRIGGNSNLFNAGVVLTKPGQVLNISRIDIGGDGTNNYNALGNDMIAGTNTSGTVAFGDGTDRIVYLGSNTTNNFVRDLTAYQIGGGTMELNFRLDDTDADSHTSFTKIGRGVVNFNGQNDVNGTAQHGDVEQLNMSGGLLRLTNYGLATGRRFDNGAMITFAGGGIEMDGTGAIQNETANYTGAAVLDNATRASFPDAQTLINPGGTDVIVTAIAGRTITMNIGSTTLNTNRRSGGTLNFVENNNGGSSVITFEGAGGGSIQANDTAYAWATYGDTYTYNAAAATYTVNALDFAMTTGANGHITQYAGANRLDGDDVALWTSGFDVSENGVGFSGTTPGSLAVNTIHFDADAVGTVDVEPGGLTVTSGGIMVSSLVATDTSLKTISGGPLMADGTNDLIIHQYGAAPMTISSIIQDTGGNALVKTGSGELILTADNTYTGRTFFNGGALVIDRAENLGAVTGGASQISLAGGGTGFAVGDTIVLSGQGGSNAVVRVTAISSDSITGIEMLEEGTGFSGTLGALTVDSTSGSGTGADFNVDTVGGAHLHFGGGTLTATSDIVLNNLVVLGGNGGEINVAADKTLAFGGVIISESNVIANYSLNPAVGRLDKTGPGTLLLTADADHTYTGLTDVIEGTLRWENATASPSATFSPFGTTFSYLDGTIVRSGATLALHGQTDSTNRTFTINEWFTFEGGSTLDVAPVSTDGDHDFNLNLRGILNFDSLGNAGTTDGFVTPSSLAGATVVDVARRDVRFNDDGGYVTGDGGITKTGAGTLSFRENNPEWTGQLVVLQGSVNMYGAGDVLGTGTLPIILGHSLLAEQAGEVVSGNSTINFWFRDEGAYRDVNHLRQDIIVRNDEGAGGQAKRIGAAFLANIDEVNYDGNITLRDDVQLYYRDDTRNSDGTGNADVRNDTRSYGTLTNQETVFINFNGNFIGAVGNDITTTVEQFGNANENNGSDTVLGASGIGDDLVVRAIFGINGDNSGWAGDLTIGNSTGVGDVDTQHIVTFGNPLAIFANNNVTIRSDATMRVSGNDIVIGNLAPANANLNAFIENSSATSPGSITITQTSDATVDAVLRDGETVFILQPGESYQALSFKKAGPAMLELTQENSFTGSTTLAGGTLRLGYLGDYSMLADDAPLIMNDGILDLAGTVMHTEIVDNTQIFGTVAIERSTGSSVINLNAITRPLDTGTLRIGADNIATTDNLNTNNILDGWITVDGSWAKNDTNSADGFIVGLVNFDQDIDRLAGGAGTQLIADNATHNVNIIEAGTAAGAITMAAPGTTTINTLRQGADGSTVGPAPTAVVDIETNILRIASGGILLPDGSSALTFNNGSLTAGATDDTAATLFLQSQDTDTNLATTQFLTVQSAITNNGSGVVDVRTTGPGVTVFTGANTYTGETLVGSGILSIGDGNTAGQLGSGGVKVEASAILAFNRSDAGLIVDGGLRGNGTVVQEGSGTTTLNTVSPVSGLNFVAVRGTLATGADDAINTTGTYTMGEVNGAAETSTLDLTNGSATVGGLVVQTNSAAANSLIIGNGKTLTINGEVFIGTDGATDARTNLTATGAGNLVVNSSGGNFQVGGATGGTNANLAVVDLSGLANFTADLGIGVFRIGDNTTGFTNPNPSSMKLAGTSNTITAGTLRIGDGSGDNVLHTLTLGAGTNTLNSDLINVGSAVDNLRSSGEIVFDSGDSTGSVKIRGSDGTSRAVINLVNTTGNTGNNISGTLDFAGHDADILASIVTMALRTRNSGNADANLNFDQGTLDISGLVMASRDAGNAAATGDATATLNLGDSAAPGTPTASIGQIDMAINTSNGGAVSATINVTGGNVTIGTGSGTAINMAHAEEVVTDDPNPGDSVVHTVTSNINLSGGSTIVTGNIIRTGGTGVENATITLEGGSLDLSGNSIGTATEGIAFVTESGTLANLGELNGGGTLTKTTVGTLTLAGTNNFTGNVAVNEGTFEVAGTAGTGMVSVITGATLVGTGTIRGDTTIASGAIVNPGVAAGGIGDLSWENGAALGFESGSTANFLLSTTPGTGDMLSGDTTNTLNLVTGSTFTVTFDGAYVPMHGDSWTLLADWTAITGDFNVGTDLRQSGNGGGDLFLPDLGTGFMWDVGSFLSAGSLTVIVPEPGRMALVAFGLMALAMRRRRR